MSSNDNPVDGAQPATLPQEHDRALRFLIEEIDCACLIIEECSSRNGDTVCRSISDDSGVYAALIHAGEYLVDLRLREMEATRRQTTGGP